MIFRTAAAFSLALAFGYVARAADTLTDSVVLNLNVVALDNKGQPVNDLKVDDFEVNDAGKPRAGRNRY